MIKKQNQWRKANKRVFGFTDERLGKAYRLLFGKTNRAGCAICGEDRPKLLDIHRAYGSNDFRVLCVKCRGREAMNACTLSAKYSMAQGVIS